MGFDLSPSNSTERNTPEVAFSLANRIFLDNLSFPMNTYSGNSPGFESRPETYIVPILLVPLFVIGLLGNSILVLIFIREKFGQTSTSVYTLNLSIGDLIVFMGAVPFLFTLNTVENWPHGELICKVTEVTQDVSVNVTALTLTAMSIDRYIAVVSAVSRLQARQNDLSLKRSSVIVVIGIWMVSLIFALPTALNTLVWEFNLGNNVTVVTCCPFNPYNMTDRYPRIIILAKFVFIYVIPLIIIACCYSMIARQLVRNLRSRLYDRQMGRTRSRQKAKFTSKIVFVFVVLFMVCFLPHHLFQLWLYFYPRQNQDYGLLPHILRILAFLLTIINSTLNPITLYLTSDPLKKLFRKYLSFGFWPESASCVGKARHNSLFWYSPQEAIRFREALVNTVILVEPKQKINIAAHHQ